MNDTHPALYALIDALPPAGSNLTHRERTQFLAAFAAVLDYLLPEVVTDVALDPRYTPEVVVSAGGDGEDVPAPKPPKKATPKPPARTPIPNADQVAAMRNTRPELLTDVDGAASYHEWKRERMASLRWAATERFQVFNSENPMVARTLYAALNAVTETADWREGKGADVATLFGDRAAEKQRAFATVVRLAHVSSN